MGLLCRSRSTHWKQTVVYLEDTITICQGEVITGTLTPCHSALRLALLSFIQASYSPVLLSRQAKLLSMAKVRVPFGRPPAVLSSLYTL